MTNNNNSAAKPEAEVRVEVADQHLQDLSVSAEITRAEAQRSNEETMFRNISLGRKIFGSQPDFFRVELAA
jgi:hypothetical protein